MQRRQLVVGAVAPALFGGRRAAARVVAEPGVLRVAFPATSFDPPQTNTDLYSSTVIAQIPDGGFLLGIAYGPNAREANDPRFALAAFDRLSERQRALPDGPRGTP